MSRPARRVAIAVAATALLAVSACSSTPDGPAPEAADGGGDGAFPVTLTHQFGETRIESEPTRVVTVGYNEQDYTLALGVVPVGVREYLGYDYEQRPWAQEQLDGAVLPTVGAEEISFEAVAALEPDLILGVYSFMEEGDYELLSAIAPTVAQSGDFPPGGVPWQEQTLVTGEALGLPEQAQALVEDVEGQFEQAREANPSFASSTLAVDYFFSGVHTPLAATDLRFRFFSDLGFGGIPDYEGSQSSDGSTGLSDEDLDLLDQDVLVVAGAPEADVLGASPLFAGLDVVTSERTVFLGAFDEDLPSALGFGSPLSLPYALDTIVPLLAEASAGQE